MSKPTDFVIKDGVLVEYKSNSKHVDVPEGVTHLGANVFNNAQLTSVTLPQSLQGIGAHALSFCDFKQITIPEGVTVINSKAFFLSSVREITCGNNLTKVGSNALECTPWQNEQPKDAVILGNALLSVLTDAETYRVPDTVTLIGDSAFEKRCKKLRVITVPENVKIIGAKAFAACPKLERVIVEGTPEFADNCLPSGAVLCAEKLSIDAIKLKILKHQAVLGFFLCGKANAVPKNISTYLAKNFEKMLPDLDRLPGLLEALMERNALTIEQVDFLLEKAAGNTERTAQLLDYKNRAFSTEKREQAAEMQLKKQLKGPTVAELKKQWTVVNLEDGTLGLSYYKGLDLDVHVPAMIGKKQVTKILKECFCVRNTPTSAQQDKIMDAITQIHIPDGIVSIGSLAFTCCGNLKAVFIPASVKSISEYAFMYVPKNTIYGPAGSYAETYAKQHNIPFAAE